MRVVSFAVVDELMVPNSYVAVADRFALTVRAMAWGDCRCFLNLKESS